MEPTTDFEVGYGNHKWEMEQARLNDEYVSPYTELIVPSHLP